MNEARRKPDTIAHYRLIREIGRGGMSVVYLAEDLQLPRKVAIKLLTSSRAENPDILRRFSLEARAASGLNHPNIVTIHEIGEAPSGRYIVMEFVRGRTLRSLVREGYPLRKLLDVGAQVAEALEVAHRAGITHRDIKPENVMVREDGYAKLLDFGLARIMPAGGQLAAEHAADRTSSGMLIGTVRYMSPEQARGEEAAAASDLFSLGVVLYEAATGVHPFATSSVLGTLNAIIAQQPAPPSRLKNAISPQLEALLLHMLEKDARLRPAAGDVRRALAALTGKEEGGGFEFSQLMNLRRRTVGREKERERMAASYQLACGGRSQLLCVAGEPGIGKTTIVEEFLNELTLTGQPCRIGRGRCSERLAGTEAYLPWMEALASLAGEGSVLTVPGPAQPEGSMAARLASLAPAWRRQIAPQAHTHSSTQAAGAEEAAPASQERLKREFCLFLQETSRECPVVLFLDDLHWADASTVDLLAYVAGHFQQMRTLVVVTYRPSEMLLAGHPFLQLKPDLQARGICHELTPDFLRLEDVRRYLSLEMPINDFPAELAALIQVKTEGNPLFMTDLVRYLRDRRVIAEQKGRWALARPVPEIEGDLPESVRGLIQRKLDQLDESERRLAVCGAVQGYSFDSAVLAKALSLEATEVEDRLERLEKLHGLIRQVSEREFPDKTLTAHYRFVHVLYQNALFTSLKPARKVALSRAVAETLLGFYGGNSAGAAAELAFLFEAAREWRRAAEFFLQAARNAMRLFADHEASTLARRGLEMARALPDGDERDRFELKLQIALGLALMSVQCYGSSEVKHAYERAERLCARSGDEQLAARVHFGLSVVYIVRSEQRRAKELIEANLQLARKRRDPVLLTQANWMKGFSAECLGQAALAVAYYREAIALAADVGRQPKMAQRVALPSVYSRTHLARVLLHMGFPEQSMSLIRESNELAKRNRFPISFADAVLHAIYYHVMHGHAPEGFELASTLAAFSREHALHYYDALASVLRGWALTLLGNGEEGVATMREGLVRYRTTESQLSRPYYLSLFAEALGATGKWTEGLAAVDEAAEAVESTDERYFEAEVHRLRGVLLLGQQPATERAGAGEAGREAEIHFLRSISVARAQGTRWLELRATNELHRLHRQTGRPGESRGLLRRLYESFSEGWGLADLRAAREMLGLPGSGLSEDTTI